MKIAAQRMLQLEPLTKIHFHSKYIESEYEISWHDFHLGTENRHLCQLRTTCISCELPGKLEHETCLVMPWILLLWKPNQTLRGLRGHASAKTPKFAAYQVREPLWLFANNSDLNEVFKVKVLSSHHPTLDQFFYIVACMLGALTQLFNKAVPNPNMSFFAFLTFYMK